MSIFSFVKEAGVKLWESVVGSEAQAAESLQAHVAKVGLGNPAIQLSVEGEKVTASGEVATQEEKEKILLALGNVEGVSEVEDNITVATPAPEARFVTVKKGDTLSAIAKAELGNANAYMKIFEANKPMLSHPDKIYPGQVLRIPSE
ncbi:MULTISPECIES: peptidoglycan-binding protein LysM [Pseudomonas]|jgi:nucleoid-associated protein YgaU|uniref:Potassium binding protein Kbp n=1 Tax=Pseudomonas marincola TaxID=437900 RepID=A0A653E4C4_9PSED|nr:MULTISPECIES: peptidoglycan-binding protein LysM [Pseudomonas]MAB99824.1 peptidoglycan-binding protein LysM [Pseudomonadaceae bacterium]MBQ55217.1 peptidoglycan-binding protein LysM [Pseudomonadaceae bacterium]NRH28170.1 peptidoglycan-binding protein LysM [Pseudomonas sp. MS19]OEO23215.1 peptidoglycan-binding protein LysM [Pseudomonas sp. J237]CAE6885488.1 K(+) binding protein [Pseudomonas marincola]|tara:strand:+ start:144 stop:584 length:441 start_codon:yes stop_codon:yes gene_type:complete